MCVCVCVALVAPFLSTDISQWSSCNRWSWDKTWGQSLLGSTTNIAAMALVRGQVVGCAFVICCEREHTLTPVMNSGSTEFGSGALGLKVIRF